jgi:hypothetical protein
MNAMVEKPRRAGGDALVRHGCSLLGTADADEIGNKGLRFVTVSTIVALSLSKGIIGKAAQ